MTSDDGSADRADDIGARIRARRDSLGLSQAQLAARLAEVSSSPTITRHDISRWEHGARRPGWWRPYLDQVLGNLDTPTEGHPALVAAAESLPELPADEFDRLAAAIEAPRRTDQTVVEHLAVVLARQRALEDEVGARGVLPAVLAEVDLIDLLAHQARGSVRCPLIDLAGQYRQFLGWIGEDIGDPGAALAHYDRAMDTALETGDANMSTSVLSLKSHLAWSQRYAGRAIGLAEAGGRGKASPGVLALITQQEARGYALDGDAERTDRLMDRAEALTATAAEHPECEPPWIYFHGPDRVLFQRGVAHLELGRYASAVDLFTRARLALPPTYRRDHGRYAANLALAGALAGELDRASRAAMDALNIMIETGSAHTLSELRRARRAMNRWPDAPEVREFDAALRAALAG